MANVIKLGGRNAAKSEEYVHDSSSDSDAESTSVDVAQNQLAKQHSISLSDDDSDAQSRETSDSEASTASSTSTRSAGSKRRSAPSTPAVQPARKKSKISPAVSSHRERNSYNPPSGYAAIRSETTNVVSEVQNMFTNLSGKQIWHITAPASIPITSIKSLDITAALRGEPIFHHKGTGYNMFAASSKGETLLVPRGPNSTYYKAKSEISRNFYLRELSQTHTSVNGTEPSTPKPETIQVNDSKAPQEHQFFANKEGSKRKPREQPSGLLMRYQPYGSAVSSKRPCRLPNPEVDEDKANDNIPKNTLITPLVESSEGAEGAKNVVDTLKQHKDSKKSKTSEVHQVNDALSGDEMEVDMERTVDVKGTPRSKGETRVAMPESERKRKKQRKEKAF